MTDPATYTFPDLTKARVLADSISSTGARLTTVHATFPRFVLAEFNTHRQLSRNSASSRAIPTKRQIELIEQTPFVPQAFPVNQPGMEATEYITLENNPEEYAACVDIWLGARDEGVSACRDLTGTHNVHKQIANRVLEPFMWHDVIASGTWMSGDWPNFFGLRISKHAQPEIYRAAKAIRDAIELSEPVTLNYGQWHLPLIEPDDERPVHELIKSSVARVAAVSYNRHDRQDVEAEMKRFDGLATNRHLSPCEHAATPEGGRWGNFTGWKQARWWIEQGFPLPMRRVTR